MMIKKKTIGFILCFMICMSMEDEQYEGYLRQSEVEFLFKNCYQKALSIDCRGN